MQYTRPVRRNNEHKNFEVGTHVATIKKVLKKKSKNNSDMFLLNLVGDNEEKGFYYLVFGNEYTEENLGFLLSSIEDNGVSIPNIEFGFNKETFDFLADKEVYIMVEEKEYQGNSRATITTFLTQEEFENSETFGEEEAEF